MAAKNLDEKILAGLVTFEGVLGWLSIITGLAGAAMVILFIGSLVLLVAAGDSSSGTASAVLASVISGVKGAVLLYTLFEIGIFRQAVRDIWEGKDEFFWEQSIREDRGLWVNAGVRGLIVCFLYLFCTGA